MQHMKFLIQNCYTQLSDTLFFFSTRKLRPCPQRAGISIHTCSPVERNIVRAVSRATTHPLHRARRRLIRMSIARLLTVVSAILPPVRQFGLLFTRDGLTLTSNRLGFLCPLRPIPGLDGPLRWLLGRRHGAGCLFRGKEDSGRTLSQLFPKPCCGGQCCLTDGR